MSNAREVFTAATNEELAQSYDKWATRYDSDLADQGGPREAVAELAKYVSHGAKILDAGCGTGVVGQLLAEQGYTHLEGLDLSAGMLEQAALKNYYGALHQQALGEPLNFANATFDAITVVGVFVMAHVKSNAFDELLRITKPGGHLIFTLRPEFYANTDFKPTMEALEKAGRWQLVSVTEPFHGRFKLHPEVYLQVWVYKVND
jgi:ubiquinone/menaquinone biosynthesis C-methylase UbiE